jgi:hypothetical protein
MEHIQLKLHSHPEKSIPYLPRRNTRATSKPSIIPSIHPTSSSRPNQAPFPDQDLTKAKVKPWRSAINQILNRPTKQTRLTLTRRCTHTNFSPSNPKSKPRPDQAYPHPKSRSSSILYYFLDEAIFRDVISLL